MILHPGVLALLLASAIVSVMALFAAFVGLSISRHWDITSSSELQLTLEKKTYLVATIINTALIIEVLSLFLFVFTADDIHKLFVGAMCATGSLNAEPTGWYVLYAKILTFVVSSAWLFINHIDQRCENYPLVKFKYKLLLLIAPLILFDFILTLNYFSALKPQMVTTCCSSLFSAEEKTVASALAALPVKQMMYVFYISTCIMLVSLIISLRTKSAVFKYLLFAFSIPYLLISLASVISFISIYYYELPTHHCPFDLLQGQYNYVGYPLYAGLFGTVAFAMGTGIAEFFKRLPGTTAVVENAQKKWAALSIIFLIVFAVLSVWPVVFTSFTPF
ncbi:hypothetical protein [Candidatus Magnetomonas plexicatena]|uniref:hypothetical protein n=1 Tax=Candidatus Magnetomonas plexicatena TaxID=2552947 RepID=UPI001C76A828|nr:hypothetical protein E2O03_002680 [Nitrospirales bacterium LBB_01]